MSRLFEEFPPVSTAEWEAEIARDLRGRDLQTLSSKVDGLNVHPFYRSEDVAGVESRELYASREWKIACEVGDAESARYAVSRGAQALYVNGDVGTYDDVEIIHADSPDLARAGAGTVVEQVASLLQTPDAKLVELTIDSNYFLEIAKLRALRALWQGSVRIVARTTKRDAGDPYVNLVRGATQAMAAIIGGCDILVVQPFDESPTALSRRLSINTQLILRDESHFGGMPDPAAGCWFLESLTEQIVCAVRRHQQERA